MVQREHSATVYFVARLLGVEEYEQEGMLVENSASPSPELSTDIIATTGHVTCRYFSVDEDVDEEGLF